MSEISEFQEKHPSRDSYWRSVILFGRNVASYKFALAEALIELAAEGRTEVSLEELAVHYSRFICEHVKGAPRQATSRSSRFITACKGYNEGSISYDQLIDMTVKLGFNNVIDAFHIVNSAEIPLRFYEKDYRDRSRKIILTDEVFKLLEQPFGSNFKIEAESRWRLVETAWELGLSSSLLKVRYDDEKEIFFIDSTFRRKDVTSARGALNGYQKGKCFYCFDDISVADGENSGCDVDHFFPHALQPYVGEVNLDGVWNLVLSCKGCNRGENGKFARVPALKYLERLSRRNEFLINSHHPLRETIMAQTGMTAQARHDFLQEMYGIALDRLLFTWEAPLKGEEIF